MWKTEQGSHLIDHAAVRDDGSVSSTVRDAHVRDIEIAVLRTAAAFSREVHDTPLQALRPVSGISTVAQMSAALEPF